MAIATIVLGVLLIVLGGAGYSASAAATALIPAGVGAVLLLCGVLACDERRRKLWMHIAVTVGLAGFLGSVRGLMRLPDLLAGVPLERPLAVKAQSAMAVMTGVFVALCVRSFINARRNRKGA